MAEQRTAQPVPASELSTAGSLAPMRNAWVTFLEQWHRVCPFRAFNDVSGLSEAYSRVPMDTYERPLSGLCLASTDLIFKQHGDIAEQ